MDIDALCVFAQNQYFLFSAEIVNLCCKCSADVGFQMSCQLYVSHHWVCTLNKFLYFNFKLINCFSFLWMFYWFFLENCGSIQDHPKKNLMFPDGSLPQWCGIQQYWENQIYRTTNLLNIFISNIFIWYLSYFFFKQNHYMNYCKQYILLYNNLVFPIIDVPNICSIL